MKPICVKCQCFFRPKTTGLGFIEGMPIGNAARGTAEPSLWKPYKLWSGDLWECPDCFSEIIVGTGLHPISEHFESDFGDKVLRHNATFQVNDC